jgi:hypothetical protein
LLRQADLNPPYHDLPRSLIVDVAESHSGFTYQTEEFCANASPGPR